MAAKILLLTLFLTATAVCAKEDNPPPPEQKPKPVYYDLDKAKLHDMWYVGAIRGLIKMKARASLADTSWIENTVYQQCEQNAKSTVDLAKCAVRVFDARDFEAQGRQEKKESQKPIVNISMKKAVQSTDETTSVVYTTVQHEKPLPKTKKHYYYKAGYGWVKNPIRSQLRRRRARRDAMDEAWDMFLPEQRMKQKKKRRTTTTKSPPLSFADDDPERNILGMKRLLGYKTDEAKKRQKRKVDDSPSNGSSMAVDYSKIALEYLKNFAGKKSGSESSLHKLRRIQEFVEKSDKVKAYYKLMNDENQQVMKKYNIQSEDPQVEKDASSVLTDVVQAINDFVANKIPNGSGKLSIMSPRLFSFMPEGKTRNRLFSPTVFSFHNDGFFSLPGILDVLTSSKKYQQSMLEMLLDLSGAGIALDKALGSLKKDMDDLDNVHYPLLQQMSRHDHNWIRAKRSFSQEQQDDYDKQGFAYLTKEQMDLMYANKNFTQSWGMNTTQLAGMSKEEKDRWVEKQIREIAVLGRPVWPFWNQSVRRKRQAHDSDAIVVGGVSSDAHSGIEWDTLRPFAFTNFVNHGISLEVVTLSPRAFYTEILAPEALTVHTLSPRAFVATILSPSALMSRILTPGALRAEVLSPRALQAWVLSPEALITEVLTPHFLEPRILSPEALVIFVLSPKFLSANVLSAESVGVVVLSPNILSPRIASEEKMLVEILSPHILGGPHSHEEAHHDVLELGSHSEHSDEGHPHEHTEGHDEHGHAIMEPRQHETVIPPVPPNANFGTDPLSQLFRPIG